MGVMEEIFNEFGLDPAPKRKANMEDVKRKFLHIPYVEGGDAFQSLDIYLPDTAQECYPVLIQIHGGGFLMGDKGDYLLEKYKKGLDKGYAVVSVNYNYSTEVKFPVQICQCKAAIRFLRAHAAQYHLDPKRFAVAGESAGGYLAAMVALTPKVDFLTDLSMGNKDFSQEVTCCVDFYGPTDFALHDQQLSALGLPFMPTDSPRAPENYFLGDVACHNERLNRMASPLTYVSPEAVPFYITHGDQDNIVPILQSTALYEALSTAKDGKDVILEIVPGVNHEDPIFETDGETDKMYGFLKKYMG